MSAHQSSLSIGVSLPHTCAAKVLTSVHLGLFKEAADDFPDVTLTLPGLLYLEAGLLYTLVRGEGGGGQAGGGEGEGA